MIIIAILEEWEWRKPDSIGKDKEGDELNCEKTLEQDICWLKGASWKHNEFKRK